MSGGPHSLISGTDTWRGDVCGGWPPGRARDSPDQSVLGQDDGGPTRQSLERERRVRRQARPAIALEGQLLDLTQPALDLVQIAEVQRKSPQALFRQLQRRR